MLCNIQQITKKTMAIRYRYTHTEFHSVKPCNIRVCAHNGHRPSPGKEFARLEPAWGFSACHRPRRRRNRMRPPTGILVRSSSVEAPAAYAGTTRRAPRRMRSRRTSTPRAARTAQAEARAPGLGLGLGLGLELGSGVGSGVGIGFRVRVRDRVRVRVRPRHEHRAQVGERLGAPG